MNSPTQTLSLPNLPLRIAAARKDSGLKQEQLAKLMGFKDRQTLTAIEAGQRRLAVEELLALMEATGKDMEYFTDPFRLIGEAGFSYRASGATEIEVDDFEQRVGGWLSLWRHLGEKCEDSPGALRGRLALNDKSTYEDAQKAGEQVAEKLKLGAVPSERLEESIEEFLKILVLAVDMPEGISGVAVQLTSGDAILTNRNEPAGRRAFDLAHELFHVLTWDSLPPERVDRANPSGTKAKRVEQLADNFAGSLLIPRELLGKRWQSRPQDMDESTWLQATAGHFKVSAQALFWRMIALGHFQKNSHRGLLAKIAPSEKSAPPAWFSRKFLERTLWGIDKGEISVRRTMGILDMDLEEFRTQCQAHGLEAAIGI